MRNWFRWLLVVPSMLLAWFLNMELFYGGIYFLGSFCAPDDFGPWICGEPWYMSATQWLLYVCTALPVFLAILGAVFVAPTNKRVVAVAAFLVSVGVSVYLQDTGQIAHQIALVILGGILGLGAALKWLIRDQSAPMAAIRRDVA